MKKSVAEIVREDGPLPGIDAVHGDPLREGAGELHELRRRSGMQSVGVDEGHGTRMTGCPRRNVLARLTVARAP